MPIENINIDLCNGCGACVKSCPMDVIRMDDKIKKAVIKYALDCMACYNCELDCPTEAIYVSPEKGMVGLLMWD